MKTGAICLVIPMAVVLFGIRLTAQGAQGLPAVPQPFRTPMTLGERYVYALRHAIAPPKLILLTVRAGMDQATNTPTAWGRTPASYAERVASGLGRNLVRENIAFGVAAVDHEDPRYFPCEKGSGWARTKHALRRTVIARNDVTGQAMPAYSALIADYGTPFVMQTWRPSGYRPLREFRSGSIALGMDGATNLWREFSPDLWKNLHFHSSHP